MKPQIRHRRLYAFYNSKVLNSLMIVIVLCLFLMLYMHDMLLPVLCGSIALACFIGYSLWLWIGKPASVVINTWLSQIDGLLTLYFLVVCTMRDAGRWWSIVPVALTVVLFFVSLIQDKDEEFHIR